MYDDRTIAVIIPALNEEQSLPRVLDAIPRWVDTIVVVDNGSADQTAGVARSYGAKVVHEPRRGYGAACLAGIAAVPEADTLVFLDADFSDHPEQMDRLIEPIVREDADLVIGSRTRGRHQRGALNLAQRSGNALACSLIHALWRHRYSDLGPFRAVRSVALDCLAMEDTTYGWTIQMQIRAIRAGLRIRETPVDYRRRIGRSKISGTLRGIVGAGTKILTTVLRECLRPAQVSEYPVRQEHLMVFTRFPEPGSAKTRLIPTLGPAGAADLQRIMTVQTLQTADRLRFTRGVSSEVRFAGGDRRRMADLFGRRRTYLPQRGNDLGARMRRAFDGAFARGAGRAVVIGTDCPALDRDHLDAAFDAMETHDCVIGPACDGGYYLIGMRRTCRELFNGIAWSSAHVLRQTLERAASAGLTVKQLPVLADVDESKDLPICDQHRRPRVSVIIPARNEAELIEKAIECALVAEYIEVLVVDGGSHDGTPEVAKAAGVRVISAPAGRALQMNIGAAAALGSILIFVHADTCLPRGYADEVQELLTDPGTALAAFRLGIEHPRAAFRWIERLANLRSRWLRLPYGDQALALRTSDFFDLGGFRDLPVMEDFELVRRARRTGRIALARSAVQTSPRRWLNKGILRLTLIHQACILGFRAGVSPKRIAAWRGHALDKTLDMGNFSQQDLRSCKDSASGEHVAGITTSSNPAAQGSGR